MEFSNIKRIHNKVSFTLKYEGMTYDLIALDEDIRDSALTVHDFDKHKADVCMGDQVIFQVNAESEDDYFDVFFDLTEKEQSHILEYYFENNSRNVFGTILDLLEYTVSLKK